MNLRYLAILMSLTAVGLPAHLLPSLKAAVPEQFQAWGTAGPEFPPAPAGWREEIWKPEGLPPLTPTVEEQRRGCVTFKRDPFSEIDPNSPPAPAERVTNLFAFATPGEYEPVTLAIHALEDLRGVSVGLGELRATNGSKIPPDFLDVRLARSVRVPANAGAKTFRWRPFLLERRVNFTLTKGNTALIWLTIKAPDDAVPGDYRGQITVQPEGKATTTVNLEFKVLPFTLPPPPVEMGIYYPRPPSSDAWLAKELIDLREHGLSPPIPALEVQVESRDRVFGDDDVAATRAHCERLLRAEGKVFGPWRFPLTFEVGHQITHAWDNTQNWFTYWPHTRDIEADLAKAIGVLTEAARIQGVTSLRAYLIDEGGAHNLLDEAVYYDRFVKERFPRLDTTTTIGGGIALGQDEIGALSGVVDFLSVNRFTPEIARALSAQEKPFGLYNGAGSTPAGVRFFFGFHGWKSGAAQIAQWAYSFGEAVFQGNGLRQEDEGYVYHAVDGPLPSTLWEAVREGVDDYRYAHLLWRMIGTAKNADKPGARAAAARAEQVFTGILSQMGWGFQAVQSGDRTPPPHPSTMRKWRWQVAQQILALRGFAPATAVESGGPRPRPLDLPWRETPKAPEQFGPEMLPPSDFESGLKPWRVEAWKGQGQGLLVGDEKHRGQQSARIAVPATSGNSAVTVLVWPQYGDGKLNLTLEGEHTYEFAAWAKWKDRGVPPELRVNVPSTAIASIRTGRDQLTTDGWQRLWTRVRMKSPAQPTYLAVWVQGPGTVWVDDLSLREAIPPPLVLSLDQTEYDAQDQAAIGMFTVDKRIHPTQVRVNLLSPSRGVVEEMTARFDSLWAKQSGSGLFTLVAPADLSESRLVFSPAVLAPGQYECQVTLLDSEQRELAKQSVVFARISDAR